jgi:hypothetical protein
LLETSFDRKRVGFRFSVLAELNSFGNSERAADSRDELLLRNPVSRETSDRMLVYYTNDKGHGNSGHAFADDWPDEEIFAILEFLKSVSGPNVLPADPVKMGVRFSEGFKER